MTGKRRRSRATRRRLLGSAGAVLSTVVLAGCGGPGEEGGDQPGGEDGETESEEGTGNGQDVAEEEEEEDAGMEEEEEEEEEDEDENA